MSTKKEHGKIDWMITLVPLAIVIALCVLFFFVPEQSNAVLSQIRFFFGDTFGLLVLEFLLFHFTLLDLNMEILFSVSRMRNRSTPFLHGVP